jgi:hypothetical protein
VRFRSASGERYGGLAGILECQQRCQRGQRLAVDLRNCSRRLEDPQPAILLSPPATQFGCGSSSNGIKKTYASKARIKLAIFLES